MVAPTDLPATQLRSQQERELKWFIATAHAAQVEQRFMRQWGPGQLLDQDNRFYDCADGLLRSQRMSLRLRRENQHIVLTCKQRKAVTSSLHHQHEEECHVNTALWASMSEAPVIDPLALPIPAALRRLLGQRPLLNLGGFHNRRRQWQIGGDTLCLDFSTFNSNYSEWEIEVEIGDLSQGEERERYWRALLHDMQIELIPQNRSKLQRFIEGPEPQSRGS